jgi:ABC-type lipoprotein release transport system permease subunit
MGTLWKIALRNTARHKRRTIITAVVMMVGIAFFIMFDSMLSGMDRITVDNMAAFTTSSLKIRTPAYVKDIAATPLDKGVPEAEGVLAKLAAAGYRAAPRLRFVARLSNYEDEIPVVADAGVFDVAKTVTKGSWLDESGRNEAVMGADLAGELGLSVGDSVIVSAQTVQDVTNADEFRLVGLVKCPAPQINLSGFFVSIADARRLLDDAGGLVTEIDVFLPKGATMDAGIRGAAAVAAAMAPSMPSLRLDPLGELVKDYLAMRNMKAKFSFIMIFVVLIIAGVGIVNTILMSVYSRIREIGVLRAYGMTAKDISRLFTLEGLAVGILGSVLGVALGAGLDFLMIRFGINLDALMGNISTGSVPIAGMLYGIWNPATMAVGFVFGIVVALISARIPARMAARLEPTAALRFV